MSLSGKIESLLYISGDDGIEIKELKRVLEISSDEIKAELKSLGKKYEGDADSCFIIKNYDDKWYLLTKPEYEETIIKHAQKEQKNGFSQVLLEVLSIIAYNDPCPSSTIENIRGTDPKSSIDKLVDANLIEMVGRAETPGRPFLYSVTSNFMNTFGLKTLSHLPSIDESLNNAKDVDFFDINRFDE